MKFTSKLAATLAVVCILGGCGSKDNTIATLSPDYVITADQAYEDLMKTSTGKSAVFNYIVEQIIDANYPATEAMITDADLTVKQLVNSYTSYYGSEGTNYLTAILQQNGFKDVDDYQQSLIFSYQVDAFITDYIKNNMDTVFEDYYTTCKPRYVSHVLILMEDPNNPTKEELEKVDTVQKAIDSGEDFAEIAKKYSDDSTASQGGALGLCDKNTNFVPEFLSTMLVLEEGEISAPTKTDYGYHFIKVTSTSKEEMKNEENIVEIIRDSDSYLLYKALRNCDITFDDPEIQELYESTLDSYINYSEGSVN